MSQMELGGPPPGVLGVPGVLGESVPGTGRLPCIDGELEEVV